MNGPTTLRRYKDGADGRLKYDDDGDKVTNANHKPFLEKITNDFPAMIPAKGRAEISNGKLMTRERISKELMDGDRQISVGNDDGLIACLIMGVQIGYNRPPFAT